MKVLLKKDFKTLGKKGDIKDVSDGYACNYLIPNGICVVFNEQTKLEYQKELEREKQLEEKRYQDALSLKQELENLTLVFYGVPNQHGYLTGTVSNKEIKKELEQKHNIKLDKKAFNDTTIVNTFGMNHVVVELHKKVKATLNVLVCERNKK